MKSPTHNNNKNLDELISRAIGREQPEFDFDKWENEHQNEIQMFKLQTADRQISHSAQPFDIWRIIMKSRISKIAAAAVIIVAVLLAICYFGGKIEVTAPVFANVMEQIYKAKTVTYKETFYPGEDREFTTEEMIIESGIMRSVLPHGDIMIFDFSSGKDLHLMPNSKRAILTQRVGRIRGNKLFNYLDWLSRIHERVKFVDEGVEFVGKEEVDGKMVDVFVMEVPFEKTTVWVNPEINLPVRVKMERWPNPDKNIIMPKMSLNLSDFGGDAYESTTISISSGRGSGKGIQDKMTIVLSDFVWNEELDESLFSLEPPEGYTLEEKQLDVSETGENGLVEALTFWTEMSDGMFPSQINDLGDPNKVKPLLIAKFDRDGDPKEEFDQAVQQMYRILKGLMFAQQCKVDGSWHYAGEGVKLGDKDTPICWWKSDDSEDYRVIFGDLSVGNLSAEKLPELP